MRIAVIGCGGAGKTTLANQLGRRLELPVLHIDRFYWQTQPDGTRRESSPDEWQRIHAQMVAGDRWVIDGMKLGVLDQRIAAADAVVFLDMRRWRCLWGVLSRRLRYRGALRPEIGVYDRVNREFLRWIWSFDATVRPQIAAKLRNAPCDVTVLRSRRQTRAFLAAVTGTPATAP